MSRDGADGFLSRWSRRKVAVQRAEAEALPAATPAAAVPQEEAPFDIASLPSIESLTADSDLAAFMQKGVPAALRDAAISRMWVSDPAIRDYIGPSEMSWDFNAAEAFPGYGALKADTDIAGMVSDIFEGQKPVDIAAAGAPEPAAAESSAQLVDAPQIAEEPVEAVLDDGEDGTRPLAAPRRRHGGATPV